MVFGTYSNSEGHDLERFFSYLISLAHLSYAKDKP